MIRQREKTAGRGKIPMAGCSKACILLTGSNLNTMTALAFFSLLLIIFSNSFDLVTRWLQIPRVSFRFTLFYCGLVLAFGATGAFAFSATAGAGDWTVYGLVLCGCLIRVIAAYNGMAAKSTAKA
jgi:hypothetical protein